MKKNRKDLIIIASATAKPGQERALEEALLEAGAETRKQAGCVEFTLLRAAGNPATLVGFERWATEADHDRHLQGPHIQKLMGQMATLLAKPPEIVSYQVADE